MHFVLGLAVWALLLPVGLTASEVSAIPLPTIGLWLLDKNGAPAHWLGHNFQGKKLFEPINVAE